MRPSSFITVSLLEILWPSGGTSFSCSRSPSSSRPSVIARKSSDFTKLPAAPINAWFCGLRFAYCSRKGSASLRYMDEESCLFPCFLRMYTALETEVYTRWNGSETKGQLKGKAVKCQQVPFI
nr:hypothetical protein Iba_chr07bCG4170 [Ipomoea batatas]GME15708.1 hypothetical protein Iba_scaffold16519CG0010 [Ipomoea batatas]